MTNRLQEILDQLNSEQIARIEQYAEILLDLAKPDRPDRSPYVRPYWVDGPGRASAQDVVDAQHEAGRLRVEGALQGVEVAEEERK